MRALQPILVSTLILGTLMVTGCSEHRYRSYDPYYGGYYGGNGAEDAYYRQWLAERRYNYIEFNRLNRERQEEYWAWRRQHDAGFRNRDNDRIRDNDRFRDNGRFRGNDHDRDDRQARNRDDHEHRDRDHDRGRDHKKDNDRDHHRDRDHDNDHDRH